MANGIFVVIILSAKLSTAIASHVCLSLAAYHSVCIDPWLLQQRRNCPICKCRIRIPGRDEDLDSVDGAAPPENHNVINEQTPLINSSVPNLAAYVVGNSNSSTNSSNEADVQFFPEDPRHTSKNCYGE